MIFEQCSSCKLAAGVAAAALCLTGGAVYADVIANFGGGDEYVPVNHAFDFSLDNPVEADFTGDGVIDVAYTDPFDDQNPLVLADDVGNENYVGPSLYGGMRAIVLDGAGRDASNDFGPRYIVRNGTADFFRAQYSPAEGPDEPAYQAYLETVLVLQKEDFLSGGDTGPVTFDADSRFDVDWGGSGGPSMRFIVRDGDTYFLSEQTVGAGEQSWTGFADDVSDGSWAEWDGSFDFDADTATFADRNFSDIQALGFYLTRSSPGSSPLFNVWQFEVSATVPEPTSLALLGLGGLTLLRRRR